MFMNIWIINNYSTPPSYGGIVRHYYFSKYLTKMGHNVRIITSSQIHNTQVNMTESNQLITEKKMDDVNYTFVRTLSYQKNNWRRIYNMVEFSINCVRVMKKLLKTGENPDIIYTSSPSPFCCYTAMRFAKKRNIPTVFEVRDLWPLSITEYNQSISENNLAIKVLYAMEKQLYKKADRIIFTMAGGKDYIRDKGWENQISIDKITQVNNGIDLAGFQRNLRHHKLNDPELLEQKKFKIIFTGSIRSAYKLNIILEVAKLCQAKLPFIKFLIYGDGTEKDMLIKLCKENNISNVSFKRRVEKKYIPFILSNANLTLLHSKNVDINKYGMSQNKLFEYLAAAKPVLVTVKSRYSLVEEYNCGIQCQDQEPETIFNAIQSLVKLPADEYEEMSNRAHNVAQEYDYPILTEKLLAIFNELLNNP